MAQNVSLSRFWALARKELTQIRRDRRLMISLVIPPTLQVLLFGFALASTVTDLKLGLVDNSHTVESRELVSAFTESRSFQLAGVYPSAAAMQTELGRGRLDLGLVIPADFARLRLQGRTAPVQLLLNAVNANTAAIAQGYAQALISWYNGQLAGGATVPLTARIALLYNPGLVNAWFIVTGTFGTLLVLNGSLVAGTAMIKEKESGTVEQLLMTPAGAGQIVLAKIAPLFLLLLGTVALVLTLGAVVFHIPIHGSLLLVFVSAALCTLAGIGIGTTIATLARSSQQTQLLSFFVNPPLAVLSGSLTPIEAMPQVLQPLTILNPIRHFATIARAVLIKGAGLDIVWPNLLALAVMAAVLLSISMWRFRKQLG